MSNRLRDREQETADMKKYAATTKLLEDVMQTSRKTIAEIGVSLVNLAVARFVKEGKTPEQARELAEQVLNAPPAFHIPSIEELES